jgi:hypothetical protein
MTHLLISVNTKPTRFIKVVLTVEISGLDKKILNAIDYELGKKA